MPRKKYTKIELSLNELPIALNAIRQSKKMTMQQFADLTGLENKQLVNNLEKGHVKLGLNRFCDICRNLQIEPKILIIL